MPKGIYPRPKPKMTLKEKNEHRKQWRKNNPDKVRSYWRRYRKLHPNMNKNAKLKQQYGITLDEKYKMYEEQKGLCKISKEPMKFEEACVDHDHVTGKVRGLILDRYNMALGLFKDSEELLQAAIEYLREIT